MILFSKTTSLLLCLSLLAACGGGGGSTPGSTTNGGTAKPVSFAQGRTTFGNVNPGGPTQVSIDGSGKLAIQRQVSVISSTQITADELALLNTDAAALFADIGVSPTPSCPNVSGVDYVRTVTVTGSDGKDYLVRDGAGNLCTYAGKAIDSVKVLNDILALTGKYDTNLSASWKTLNYAFQLSAGTAQGDTFVLQSNGSFMATRYPGLYAASTLPPVVSGTLTQAELGLLSIDIDAVQSSQAAGPHCSAPGKISGSPNLSVTDSKNQTTPMINSLGAICGTDQDVYALQKDIDLLARKYLAAPGDLWVRFHADSRLRAFGPNPSSGLSIYPDIPVITLNDTTVGTRDVADLTFSDQYIAHVNALVADILANSTPSSCNPYAVATTTNSLWTSITIPSLGGDFPVTDVAGNTCIYNGKAADAQQVNVDMHGMQYLYFQRPGNPWSQLRYEFSDSATGGAVASMTFAPNFPSIVMTYGDGSTHYATLSDSDFTSLQNDVGSLVGDIALDSSKTCSDLVTAANSKAIILSIPMQGSDYTIRTRVGVNCVYNSKPGDSSQLANDVDRFRATYFK